eukprot:TRINITY_DN4571_c0_g1_i2.p1 TRINITY_DN4571_c0_g1~~TRINITY_DN4571_c0_g1_i2.p1  ORF type:complete len:323 (+),score=62.35 TRINITY_DN4571_c0_g1_i2:438-1406(+)
MVDVHPLRMLPHSVYKCDSRFHTELLREQLIDDSCYGFIVVDGSCASFHLLVGDSKRTIFKKDVQLPKKHGRGGQSQNRFARLREESRDWYTTEIAECATKHFIDLNTHKVNVKALIVSGSASLKHQVIKKLDPRVRGAIVSTYDIQYSGEAGFNQTLLLCESDLANCRYMFEKNLLNTFFKHISSDQGLYTFSPYDTLYALEAGAVENLIVWNELALVRYAMILPSTGATKIVCKEESLTVQNSEAGDENTWQVTESQPLLDWLLDHYQDFGSDVQLVSGNSALGAQFVQGFGGVGAVLRYPIEIPDGEGGSEEEEEEYEY